MKKLMIAAAIVCAAAFVQAASVTWVYENGYTASFENIEGTLAFYLASDTDFASPLAKSPLTINEGVASGSVTGTDQTGWVARLTVTNFDEGGSWYKDYAFTMDTVTHEGSPDAATYLAALGGEVGDALTAGGWLDLHSSAADQDFKSAAIPEPTSGLLLLLGVAGLALKRKRA